LNKEEKKHMIGMIGAFLSIPMAIFVWKADLNPGWAFALGIAYSAIWRVDDDRSEKRQSED
jgi:hypothetical protein